MSVIAFFAVAVPVLIFVNCLEQRYQLAFAWMLRQWWGAPASIILIGGAPITAGLLAARVML